MCSTDNNIAAETRAKTARTKWMLRIMETLRSILSINIRDHHMPNRSIRRMFKIQNIVRRIGTERREWRDHMDRMEVERITKLAKTQVPKTRSPGRPPKRWRES